MNTKKISVLCIMLTLFIVSSASTAFSQDKFIIGFVPNTDQIQPGATITVNVTITNMPSPGLFSYEFKVTYNTTVLNATAAEVPVGHFLTPIVKASNIIVVDSGTINDTEGFISFAASLLYPEEGKVGNGTLATLTFTGLTAGDSILEVTGLTVVDPIWLDPNAIQYPLSAYLIEAADITVIPEFMVPLLIGAFAILTTGAILLRKRLK